MIFYLWPVAASRERSQGGQRKQYKDTAFDQCPICKKKHWGSPTGERVEAPQALTSSTCNTNTGVRIDPQELKSTETRGVKKIIGRVEPPTLLPVNRTLLLINPQPVTWGPFGPHSGLMAVYFLSPGSSTTPFD